MSSQDSLAFALNEDEPNPATAFVLSSGWFAADAYPILNEVNAISGQ
jgi:hypothetical protein